MKNYDYLSFDHEKGMTQWSIFFSEFSQSKDLLNDKSKKGTSQSSSLVHHTGPAGDLIQDNLQIFVSGNTLYSLTIDNKGNPTKKWNYVSEAPIFQVLKINKKNNLVTRVPLSSLLEKEQENVKLVFIGNYIYADH